MQDKPARAPAFRRIAMLRTLIHLWRLLGIVRTLARHDALFPFEDYGVAPGLVRIAKLTAFHPFRKSRGRSEEHTSELQSLMRISYAVFCLKKNKKTN